MVDDIVSPKVITTALYCMPRLIRLAPLLLSNPARRVKTIGVREDVIIEYFRVGAEPTD